MSIVVELQFHLAVKPQRRGGWKRTIQEGTEPKQPAAPRERVPRIAALMALAIHCDQLLRSGAVPDLTALARLAKVSQPRMTQIFNLRHLAPEIQEYLLFLPLNDRRDFEERKMRPLCQIMRWDVQRDSFEKRINAVEYYLIEESFVKK